MEHRVTKLEANQEHLSRSIDSLADQVSELNESLAKYRGAWGMLVMVGGAIAGAVTIWIGYSKG